MKIFWIVFFDAFSVFFGYLNYKTHNLIILKDTITDCIENGDKKTMIQYQETGMLVLWTRLATRNQFMRKKPNSKPRSGG